jgi:hypothetical protein
MKLIVLGATGGTRIEIVRQTTPSRVTTRVSLGMKTTATLGGSHCLPNPRGDFGSALWVLITPEGHAPILLGQLSIADFQSLLGCNGFHLLRAGA